MPDNRVSPSSSTRSASIPLSNLGLRAPNVSSPSLLCRVLSLRGSILRWSLKVEAGVTVDSSGEFRTGDATINDDDAIVEPQPPKDVGSEAEEDEVEELVMTKNLSHSGQKWFDGVCVMECV